LLLLPHAASAIATSSALVIASIERNLFRTC
jgi:hypothetical protein